MAGLLDFDMQNPEAQGFNNALMQAAAALLTPRHRGGGMGAAFGAFPREIDRAKANAMREQLMALQGRQVGLQTDKLGFDMEQARAKQAETLRVQRNREAFLARLRGGGFTPDLLQEGLAAGFKPEELKNMAGAQNWGREKLTNVNGVGVNPYTFQPVGAVGDPNKPFNNSIGQDGRLVVTGNPELQNYELNKARAGAPRNEFGFPAQEKEYDKARGKALAEQFGELQAGARKGFNEVATLNRMDQLLKQVSTGTLTPAMTTVKAIGDALGFKVEGVGPAQALDSLSNQMALQLRSTGEGGGMPGALSDKDRQFLVAMTPGLSKTPEGNNLIIETMRRLAQRKIEVARFAQEYESKHGRLDSGFELAIGEYVNSRPLFDDMAVPAPSAGTSDAPMSPQDYLKRHGGK